MLKQIITTAIIVLTSTFAIANTPAPVAVTTILQSDRGWDGEPLPGFGSGAMEMIVNEFVIQPGEKTVIHLHPYNGSGYIIEGELTMVVTQSTSGDFSDPEQVEEVVLGAGEAWNEAVNKWHYGVNNGDTPVRFIVVFAAEKNIPATISLSTYPE